MAESPNTTTIRFGILGCAEIARKVSRAIKLSPNSSLHAIGSRSLEKARTYAASNNFHPSTKIYGSYDEVLDDPEVDAVYVPLPTSLHLHWAVRAAEKKKHVLVEKPPALNVKELDVILNACEANGVQYMDGTMWMHHPRTQAMADFMADPHRFGQLMAVKSCFTFAANDNFLQNDIRVKPDLDSLGALGDAGWYCIRASLWAANYELPKFVTALRNNPTKNDAGVLLSCDASLQWEDGKTATFHCSFLSNLTMDVTAIGTKGTIKMSDFIIPYEESEASFTTTSNAWFIEMALGWKDKPSEHVVRNDLPQEALMVKEFSNLVDGIKRRGLAPERKWPTLSRKTQLVVDAVVASIDKGFEPVEVIY